MRTFVLLLGKSINKATGCISGICGGIQEQHKTQSRPSRDFRSMRNRAWHMAHESSGNSPALGIKTPQLIARLWDLEHFTNFSRLHSLACQIELITGM